MTPDDHSCHHDHTAAMKDPVCGMTVDPATAKHHAVHDGHDYWFCSAGCQTKFVADPNRCLKPAAAEPAAAGAIWTCPMHPEIRRGGPGSCPICGMALEPETISLDDGPNPELADMTRRLWIAAALTLPVFALDMGQHLLGLTPPWSGRTTAWIEPRMANALVAAVSVLIIACPCALGLARTWPSKAPA